MTEHEAHIIVELATKMVVGNKEVVTLEDQKQIIMLVAEMLTIDVDTDERE
jgi:hypothetical protein